MCAECHSTNLRKNYDAAADRYATTWSEINVGCEACHGAGSRHVAWAERQRDWWRFGQEHDPDRGLEVRLDERRSVAWMIDQASGSARRSEAPQRLRKEVEACGRCHSRRSQISADWRPGRPLADTHTPSLLERNLYHADGQMLDEVYNYGSFLQSKMYAKGVTCSDCHDPHTLKLRAGGDGVCLQCHAETKFQAPGHHRHEAAKPALTCASCHMPIQVNMVVDRRHDHSFRVPRPDLSAKTGAPNACNGCHKDRDADWAAAVIERWHGASRKGSLTFGDALALARRGAPEARSRLDEIAADESAPAIVRGTALSELAPYLSPAMLPGIRRSLVNADPLIQIGALRAVEALPVEMRWSFAGPLLTDSVRSVRIQAVSILASTQLDRLSADDRARFERAAEEFVAAQRYNADRPEARVLLGEFFARRQQNAEAEIEYRAALRLDPRFAQAYVNLADLYRAWARDADGVALLRDGLKLVPNAAALHHALGLALVRLQRSSEAIDALRRAIEVEPGNSRYAYVYAIALRGSGQRSEAVKLLADNHERHPADRDTLRGLVSYALEDRDWASAMRYAERLARLEPENQPLAQLIDRLRVVLERR
jgi:predicted CXXCH cytochrome family protein